MESLYNEFKSDIISLKKKLVERFLSIFQTSGFTVLEAYISYSVDLRFNNSELFLMTRNNQIYLIDFTSTGKIRCNGGGVYNDVNNLIKNIDKHNIDNSNTNKKATDYDKQTFRNYYLKNLYRLYVYKENIQSFDSNLEKFYKDELIKYSSPEHLILNTPSISIGNINLNKDMQYFNFRRKNKIDLFLMED